MGDLVPDMDRERVFAIGDIHGCLDKLVPLMNMIQLNPDQDLLLFIGDYIDRGGHSREVVDYLVDLKQRLPETIFLLGNHEQMFLEYLDGRDTDAFLYNGGKKPCAATWDPSPPGPRPANIPGCLPPTWIFTAPCGRILNGRITFLFMPGCAMGFPWRNRTCLT